MTGETHTNKDETDETSLAIDTSSVLKLPAEILLEVLSLLNVADLLNIRETCTHIDRLSRDRTVWLEMLLSQRAISPIPPPYDDDTSRRTRPLSASALSRLVISTYHTEHSFLLPRIPPVPIVPPEPSAHTDFSDQGERHAILMEVIADRWLLSIYDEGTIHIWDLYIGGATPASTYRRAGLTPDAKCCFSLQLPIVDRLSSAYATPSQDYTMLHIALASQTDCTVLDVYLSATWGSGITGDLQLHLVAKRTWKLPGPALTVRALHPPSGLTFLSHSDTLVVLQWENGKTWQLRTIEQMNEDEFWTGVIAARFISACHILCIKSHALELLALPSTIMSEHSPPGPAGTPKTEGDYVGHLPTKVHSYSLSGLTFRVVSVSEVQLSQNGTHAQVSFLAYDILRGLYLYRVNILLPPSDSSNTPYVVPDSLPPQMTVRLLALHRLAQLYAFGSGHSVPRGRSGFTPGSRGFVSACVLGLTGRRGVWIERRRGSMRRSVYAFKVAEEEEAEGGLEGAGQRITASLDMIGLQLSNPTGDEGADRETAITRAMEDRRAKRIDGRVLFEVNSYDLRDDITHCAFAESTGTVILGDRKGDLTLL